MQHLTAMRSLSWPEGGGGGGTCNAVQIDVMCCQEGIEYTYIHTPKHCNTHDCTYSYA